MNQIKIIIFSIIAIIFSCLFIFMTNDDYNYYGAQVAYRVYLNGSSIGLIKNPENLEQYINKEQEQIKQKYNVTIVYAPEGLEIKQELTYNEKLISAQEVYEKIKDLEPFTIDGYVVSIYETESENVDETETGNSSQDVSKESLKIYTLNKEIFTDAINSTILAFINEESYNSYLEERQETIKDMEEGTRIENVYIKDDIYIKHAHISITEKIFTDSKTLARYLLYSTTSSQNIYEVRFGDTISDIAEKNELNVSEFLIANRDIPSSDTLLFVGQKVIVDPVNPILTLVEESTEVEYQEIKYKTEIIEDSSFYVGYSQVIQSGQNGEQLVTMKVQRENGTVTNALSISSIETKATINRIVKTGNRTEYMVGNTGIWAWPTRSGYYLSTRYGWDSSLGYTRYHAAIDITGTGCGSPIYAANDGTVLKATYNDSLGYYIVINHNNGYITWYAHLQNKGYVNTGQAVEMGQVIGKMGTTGYSTGCHLHFVTSYNGNTFNPLQLYQ